ncbi:siderophore-interacting protein [Sphingobacterium sp. LRF_L2]|uniref:siderophore-interacting protein n=1 Tax=Sphingobacterium sp. LRF_L2 TaxID=3369421 RepID=UPI003F5DC5D3
MEKTKLEIIQTQLEVIRKEYITPHYIRIYLTGEDVARINNTTIGVNNKVLIPPKGVDKVYFPEFDYENRQWKPMSEAIRPIVRTYTHRGIDLIKNEIWIDFVAHGDEGPASSWALAAKAGDVLGILMKDGKTALYSKANNYLLVGDATAIPVLGAILEDLPAEAKGTCIIEVHGKEDEQSLYTKADIQFTWLHNESPQKESALADTLKIYKLPTENRFAYVAAEFSTVKSIRNYLRKEENWKREELYAYSYWKSGVAEDKSAAERHDENE